MKLAFVVALAVLWAAPASANRAGITGRAADGCGGTGCHAGGEAPRVVLEGPARVPPGGTAELLLRVSGGQTAAGANIEVTDGILIPRDGNLRPRAGQLTHAGGATPYVDEAAVFRFALRAPDEEGEVTVYAAGNSVNGNLLSTGDRWALTSATLTVTDDAPTEDAGVAVMDAGEDGEVDDGDDDGGDGGGCRAADARVAPLALLIIVLGLRRRS